MKDASGSGTSNGKISSVVERVTRPGERSSPIGACAPWREKVASKSTVQRIWSDNEIKPHRLETFNISNDANFGREILDVIGLYLDLARASFGALL